MTSCWIALRPQLIADVVTGQPDVRETDAQLPAAPR